MYKLILIILIVILQMSMYQFYNNFNVQQQNIRHSRSRTKFLRANHHGEEHCKDEPNSNLTEEALEKVKSTSYQQLKLESETDDPSYSNGVFDMNSVPPKNKLRQTTKSEHEVLIPLSQNLDQYLTPSRLTAPGANSTTEFSSSSKRNSSRRVTVDSSFGPTLNSSWQGSDKNAWYHDQHSEGKEVTTGSGARLQGDEVNESQLQDTFLQNDVEEQIELASEKTATGSTRSGHVDIVTRFLRIVESQHLLGENCTAGTDLNLGEGVVDRYAQERFRVEANVAVNRANMLTRIWKYADPSVVMSEYLLHASVFSMVEFDDDIFAAGNCYDQYQYKDYWLFCPYAYRLPEGPILVKDLAVEYKYLSNTSEWFYIARKNAEKVIKNFKQFSRGKWFLIC